MSRVRSVCSVFAVCVQSVWLSHGCVPALQQRLGVPQQQPVVGVHHVGLPLGHGGRLCLLLLLLLVLILVFIRAVKGFLSASSLLQQRLLQSVGSAFVVNRQND